MRTVCAVQLVGWLNVKPTAHHVQQVVSISLLRPEIARCDSLGVGGPDVGQGQGQL